jgi:hypothetical protein
VYILWCLIRRCNWRSLIGCLHSSHSYSRLCSKTTLRHIRLYWLYSSKQSHNNSCSLLNLLSRISFPSMLNIKRKSQIKCRLHNSKQNSSSSSSYYWFNSKTIQPNTLQLVNKLNNRFLYSWLSNNIALRSSSRMKSRNWGTQHWFSRTTQDSKDRLMFLYSLCSYFVHWRNQLVPKLIVFIHFTSK